MAKINPLVGIGIPTWGKVSIQWARAYRHLGVPLGATAVELEPVIGKPIAEARNSLMQQAISLDCEFLFMLGDDNLPNGDAILQLLRRLREHPELDLITGVYWTKSWPTWPYIWKGMQRGPYLDWHMGELFQIDFAGCDALLIRLSDRVKALGPTWFSTEWVWTEDQATPDLTLNTEDFYFYTRARRAGIELWCDTNVQVLHQDRTTGQFFGLTQDMPQAGGPEPVLPPPGTDVSPIVKIADMGSGVAGPFFGHVGQVQVDRFDLDPASEPTYRCDIRQLPVADQSYDVVHSRHVLEHFGRGEVMAVLTEWARVLRVGGEFRVCVPNLKYAMQWILDQDAELRDAHPYPWWQLYGEQKDSRDFHANGFTVRRLEALLERLDCFEHITVTEGDEGMNLYAVAIKAKHVAPYALTPEWSLVVIDEGAEMPGLANELGSIPD